MGEVPNEAVVLISPIIQQLLIQQPLQLGLALVKDLYGPAELLLSHCGRSGPLNSGGSTRRIVSGAIQHNQVSAVILGLRVGRRRHRGSGQTVRPLLPRRRRGGQSVGRAAGRGDRVE